MCMRTPCRKNSTAAIFNFHGDITVVVNVSGLFIPLTIRILWTVRTIAWFPESWCVYCETVHTNNGVESWHYTLNIKALRGKLDVYERTLWWCRLSCCLAVSIKAMAPLAQHNTRPASWRAGKFLRSASRLHSPSVCNLTAAMSRRVVMMTIRAKLARLYSAVAKRPHDASRLSVVSFNSTKRRVESFIIISYVGYLGHHTASCETSLVSGGVDCGKGRRNVYDKKLRHYAEDNRTAHLTARSDKSVVCTGYGSLATMLTTPACCSVNRRQI